MQEAVAATVADAPFAGALDGLTVVEIGGVAAAYAAKMLADFGADVVTLEPGTPGSDPRVPGELHRYLRTNRRLVKGPFDRTAFDDLLGRARVFITDLSETERADSELSTSALRLAHPHLLVVTISAFGSHGPRAGESGGELMMYAEGGLAQMSPGLPDGSTDPYLEGPLHPGGYPASIIVGLTAAVAVLSALPIGADDQQAAGDHLDVSGQAAVASMTSRYLAVSACEGVVADRTYPGPLNMPNLLLPCRDGFVVIAAILDNQWERLVEALGSPDWAMEESLARAAGRNAGRATIEMHLRAWCLSLDGDEIVQRATRHGVPCFRFYRIDEMERSEHVAARGSLVDVPGGHGRTMPGAPFRLSRSPWRLRSAAPDHATELSEILASPAWTEVLRGSGLSNGRDAQRPLDGVRILDFGQVLAVPFGTQWLAWLGADVILVESAAHLHSRATPPFFSRDPDPNASAIFNFFNGGKRSLTVDMKSEEGRQVLLDLVPHCDIVTENFRAGVLDRLGLSSSRLRQLRPDVILLSLGAFGRSGPLADAAGLHSAANLFSGLADVTRYPGGGPRIMGAVLPDPLAGLNAALAILLALHHRRRTGEGQTIDQAMYESLLPLFAGALMSSELERAAMRATGSQGETGLFSGFFPARDHGAWMTLEIRDAQEWTSLLDVVGYGSPQGLDDPDDSLVRLRVSAHIVRWLGERSLEESIRLLRRRGLVAGRATTTLDLLNDEQLHAIGYLSEVEHPVAGTQVIPTLPWSMRSAGNRTIGRAPLLGEHVDEILTDLLGYGEDRIAALRKARVLR